MAEDAVHYCRRVGLSSVSTGMGMGMRMDKYGVLLI